MYRMRYAKNTLPNLPAGHTFQFFELQVNTVELLPGVDGAARKRWGIRCSASLVLALPATVWADCGLAGDAGVRLVSGMWGGRLVARGKRGVFFGELLVRKVGSWALVCPCVCPRSREGVSGASRGAGPGKRAYSTSVGDLTS